MYMQKVWILVDSNLKIDLSHNFCSLL